MRVIILGAGLSGLATALALRQQGLETTILEREPEVGGLARSFRVDGYTFDYGPHFLFGPRVVSLLREIVGTGLNLTPIRRDKEKIFFNDNYFNFPFDPKNLLRQMAPHQVIGVLGEICKRHLFSSGNGTSAENVEDWVIQSVGKRIYKYTSLGEYISKLYGLPAAEIAADWGEQKLKFLARWHQSGLGQLIKQGLGEEKRLKKNVVHYPPNGIDYLAVQLADRFLALGGEIQLAATVTEVEHKKNYVKICYHQHKEKELTADALISTLPITKLVKMLSPTPPEPILAEAMKLKYRNLLLLLLCLKKEQLLDYQCIYFTEPGFIFRRVTEFKHLQSQLAPAGKTSLCLEITCFKGEELFQRDKKALMELALASLEKNGFLNAADIESSHLLRIPYAYPVYAKNYRLPLEKVLAHLAGYKNIISIGRQGLFFYNTMNNCIISGYQLGEKLSLADHWERSIQETYQQRLTPGGLG